MQAAVNNSSALDHFHFAGERDYMMRSEKRSGSGPAHRSPAPGGKPPRKRKKRAGFFYKLFMMILLLVIWPLGLLMLWRRKVRWGVATKLLTSVVTLAACIILIGFALTVNTGNAQYTAVQDSVNNFLDSAADTLIDAGDIVSEHAEIMFKDMEDVADALWEKGKLYLADGIDAGVILAQQAKTEVTALIEKIQAETKTEPAADETAQAPEESAEAPDTEETAAPEAAAEAADANEPIEESADADEDEADAAEAPVSETAEAADVETDAADEEPAGEETAEAEVAAVALPEEEPAVEDAAVADAAEAEAEDIAEDAAPAAEDTAEPEALEIVSVPATAEAEATAEPTIEPTATPEPAPQTVVPGTALKPAAQATVYHSTNGQWYHTFNRCSGMTGGGAYTLEECAATHKQCKACSAPSIDLIGQPCMWKDEFNRCHTSDECAVFEGKYTLILRDDALAEGLAGCEKCGGHEYLQPDTTIDYASIPAADAAAE